MYAMQATKLSSCLAGKIDGLVRDFWWGSEKGCLQWVADGHDTNIWYDPWIVHKKGFAPYPRGPSMNGEIKVVELLLDNGGWNIQKLNSLFDHETISAILKGAIQLALERIAGSGPWKVMVVSPVNQLIGPRLRKERLIARLPHPFGINFGIPKSRRGSRFFGGVSYPKHFLFVR
uniref:Uncharacterized protein n=1 Tax=Cannabis sativa TaxID=3483 RepID=A0A803QN22_CANSA